MEAFGGEVSGSRGNLHGSCGAYRAGIGAGAASDAEFLVQYRNHQPLYLHRAGGTDPCAFAAGDALGAVDLSMHAVVTVRDEGDGVLRARLDADIASDADGGVAGGNFAFEGGEGFGGTVLGTGAAFGLVAVDDAVFTVEGSEGDLRALFVLARDREDGALRTDGGTGGAVEIAEATNEVQMRFEEAAHPELEHGRLQNLGGTGGDTQTTAGAVVQETGHADATGRRGGSGSVFAGLRRCVVLSGAGGEHGRRARDSHDA